MPHPRIREGPRPLQGEKALALQLVARGPWDEDTVEAYYFSDLPGYGWAFPLGRGYAKLGVGGEAPIGRLREKLAQMLERLGAEPATRIKGAPIAVGGLRDAGRPAIGEEAGAVMPLTGEGIRPALLTALAMAQALEGRRGYRDALKATGLPLQIGVQLALRRLLLRLPPPERAALWRRVDPGTVARLAAGDIDRAFLASLALRHPRLAAIAARLLRVP